MLSSEGDEMPLFTEQLTQAKELGPLSVYACSLAMDVMGPRRILRRTGAGTHQQLRGRGTDAVSLRRRTLPGRARYRPDAFPLAPAFEFCL
jgi:hypothetical protein